MKIAYLCSHRVLRQSRLGPRSQLHTCHTSAHLCLAYTCTDGSQGHTLPSGNREDDTDTFLYHTSDKFTIIVYNCDCCSFSTNYNRKDDKLNEPGHPAELKPGDRVLPSWQHPYLERMQSPVTCCCTPETSVSCDTPGLQAVRGRLLMGFCCRHDSAFITQSLSYTRPSDPHTGELRQHGHSSKMTYYGIQINAYISILHVRSINTWGHCRSRTCTHIQLPFQRIHMCLQNDRWRHHRRLPLTRHHLILASPRRCLV